MTEVTYQLLQQDTLQDMSYVTLQNDWRVDILILQLKSMKILESK